MENKDSKRINVRMHGELFENVKYWAEKRGMTVNEYITECMMFKIAWENQDYPLPTMEQQRLFQLVGQMKSLEDIVGNLSVQFDAGMSSLMVLTRGDTSLTDDDDGELLPGEGFDPDGEDR